MRSPRPLVRPGWALAALVAATALAVSTLRRTLAIDDPAAERAAVPAAMATPVPGAGTPVARLAAAVSKDPFHVERRRPTARFRLPGEALPQDSVPAALDAGTRFQLIGTAVLAEGRGFAMCQWGTEPPRLVRVGERVGDLTLRVVDRGRATFTDGNGRRMEVRVPKAGT